MNNDKISISKGPQFRQGKVVLIFFLFAFLLLIEVFSIIQSEILTSLILFPFIILILNYILDIQGVEINKEKGLVREYKLFLLWKLGVWGDFKEFNAINLDFGTYTIMQRTFYTNLTTVESNYFANERYGHFLISLENNDPEKNIILAERTNYKEAQSLSMALSEKIGLVFHDIIEQRIQMSKEKRENV